MSGIFLTLVDASGNVVPGTPSVNIDLSGIPAADYPAINSLGLRIVAIPGATPQAPSTATKVYTIASDSFTIAGNISGPYAGNYNPYNLSYTPGVIVRVLNDSYYVDTSSVLAVGNGWSAAQVQQFTLITTPGVYGCVVAPTQATLSLSAPRYPEPTTGIVYWQLIAFAPRPVNVCEGGNKVIYVQTSESF